MRRLGWLAGLLIWVLVASAQDTVSVRLINGDVTRDNVIDDTDLLTVLFAMGSNDPQADLNEDGIVDDADLLIVQFSSGQVGAVPLTGERVMPYGSYSLDVRVQLEGTTNVSRWRQVWVELQAPDDVLVYQTQGWFQGASGTVSVPLPEPGVYRLQVWVQDGSWLRAEAVARVGMRVQGLRAFAGNGCAALMWDELPDDSFAGYRVYRRVGTGSWSQVATLPAGAFLYADTDLTNGISYSYKVAVVGSDGSVLHESQAVSVVPTGSVARLVWDSQSQVEDSLVVSVRASSGSLPVGYPALLVDGVVWGALGEWQGIPGLAVVGVREYKFVFADWCWSALTHDWADTFNATAFLGWREPVPVWTNPNDPFVRFTKLVWGHLAAGYRISQVLNFTCRELGSFSRPCQVYRWICEPHLWWGFCPDIRLP